MNPSDDAPRGPRMEKLTRDNHETRFAKIGDYICALDHDEAPDIWAAYKWGEYGTTPPADANDPAKRDYEIANNKDERHLRRVHNQAWAHIRLHLSDAIFQKTIELKHQKVAMLLRFLRQDWHDNSTEDREHLRTEYGSMRLEDYGDNYERPHYHTQEHGAPTT